VTEQNQPRMRVTDASGLIHVPLSDAPIAACGLRLTGMSEPWELVESFGAHETCVTCLRHANQIGR